AGAQAKEYRTAYLQQRGPLPALGTGCDICTGGNLICPRDRQGGARYRGVTRSRPARNAGGPSRRVPTQEANVGRFFISRVLSAIPTLFLVAVTVFVLIRLVPGDPAALLLGDQATALEIAALRERLGLDQPVIEQFFIWGGNILTGDFGRSI